MRGFDVELLVHDPALGDDSTPLESLLDASHVVSLHCPLLPSTHHLIDAVALAHMRPDAILVNAARGPIVDEAALVEALRTGVIAGAALDVYETEPPRDSPLFALDNVVVSPHNAGMSEASVETMLRVATQAVIDGAAGRAPAHLVNPDAVAPS